MLLVVEPLQVKRTQPAAHMAEPRAVRAKASMVAPPDPTEPLPDTAEQEATDTRVQAWPDTVPPTVPTANKLPRPVPAVGRPRERLAGTERSEGSRRRQVEAVTIVPTKLLVEVTYLLAFISIQYQSECQLINQSINQPNQCTNVNSKFCGRGLFSVTVCIYMCSMIGYFFSCRNRF